MTKKADRWCFSTKLYHQGDIYCQSIPPGGTSVQKFTTFEPSIVNVCMYESGIGTRAGTRSQKLTQTGRS